jgi:hypothetical protein
LIQDVGRKWDLSLSSADVEFDLRQAALKRLFLEAKKKKEKKTPKLVET